MTDGWGYIDMATKAELIEELDFNLDAVHDIVFLVYEKGDRDSVIAANRILNKAREQLLEKFGFWRVDNKDEP